MIPLVSKLADYRGPTLGMGLRQDWPLCPLPDFLAPGILAVKSNWLAGLGADRIRLAMTSPALRAAARLVFSIRCA
jgi:hypothetical protein